MTESENLSDFVKALRLLHSRAKDSADILKSMLDEVLRNKSTNGSKNDQKKAIKGIETAVIKSSIDYKKEIFDKKSNFDKIKSESFEYPLEKKRQRLESPQTSRSTSSSPTSSATGLQIPLKTSPIQVLFGDERQSMATTATKVEEDSEATDIEDENTDAGEFAVEMGLACVQCKQIDQQTNNQLVECQECHNLYHQECHKPPLIDQDISDPRFVWYCAKCQKTMKKIAVKPNKASNKTPVQTLSSGTAANTQLKDFGSTPGVKTPVKGDIGSESRLIQPFKREPKVSVPNTSFQSSVTNTSSTKPIGLAALANISTGVRSGTTGAGVKSKNGNNGNTSVSSTTTLPTSAQSSSTASLISSSDKRLQNIKKNKSNSRQK